MRFVIFGAGAIGGVVAARLHQARYDVLLIARGAHLQAIRRDGLTLQTPVERSVLELEAVGSPAEVQWQAGDVVLLATKSQDTLGALMALRDAAGSEVPVVCLQNGVENERVALRLMDSVYAAVVVLPAAHLEPGHVEAYGSKITGNIDVGRYPHGDDALNHEVSAAISNSNFLSRPTSQVMPLKYAKLLLNLANAIDALCGPGEASDELAELAQEEGREVLSAAGIEFDAEEVTFLEGRRKILEIREIEGRERAGSSSWQSLARGTGAMETDYLNGEIVLEGRLHGIPTPVNAALCELAARVAREGRPPASVPAAEVLATVA